MFDDRLRPFVDRFFLTVGARVASTGISANQITVTGFVVGLAAMGAVAMEYYLTGLIMLLVNRFMDGLDGAVARINKPTDLGGYLDIVLDFIFYSGFVFAFALADPERNALAASFLIFSFVGTCCSFLSYAIMAAKRNMTTEIRGKKSIYYLGGLAEGMETIAVFVLFCIFPLYFSPIAIAFGIVCWITTATRIAAGYEFLK